MTWVRKSDIKTDKVNTLVGVRYWIEIDNTNHLAKLLSWIVNNLDYMIAPYMETSHECPVSLSLALHAKCGDNPTFECLWKIANERGSEFCIKRVYGAGHGIFVWLSVKSSVFTYRRSEDPIRIVFRTVGRVFLVIDTYRGFNEKQKELMMLIDDPELVRPM